MAEPAPPAPGRARRAPPSPLHARVRDERRGVGEQPGDHWWVRDPKREPRVGMVEPGAAGKSQTHGTPHHPRSGRGVGVRDADGRIACVERL